MSALHGAMRDWNQQQPAKMYFDMTLSSSLALRRRFGEPDLLLAFDLHDATIMHGDFDGPVT